MRSQGVHDNAVVGYKSRFPLEIRSISVLMCSTACYATPRGARQLGWRNAVGGHKSRFPLEIRSISVLMCSTACYATPRGARQLGWRSQISFPAANSTFQLAIM